MMIIRAKQKRALSLAYFERFVQRMGAHIKQDFADDITKHGITPEMIDSVVRQALKDAGRYGVVGESDLRLFLDCTAIYGPHFHTELDWAKGILNRDDLDGSGKMAAINEYMIFG